MPWQKARALLYLVSELADFALRSNITESEGEKAQLKSVGNPRLLDLLNRIYVNPGHPWTREEMATSLGITVRHLNHLCYSSLGISIKKHIDEVRLQYAAKLLIYTPDREPMSIKEISHACGFSFPQHFSHYFKKHMGFTPQEFRAQPGRV
jgi:AraC-like DNA-binding protein